VALLEPAGISTDVVGGPAEVVAKNPVPDAELRETVVPPAGAGTGTLSESASWTVIGPIVADVEAWPEAGVLVILSCGVTVSVCVADEPAAATVIVGEPGKPSP
jgi:hypothetical protein